MQKQRTRKVPDYDIQDDIKPLSIDTTEGDHYVFLMIHSLHGKNISSYVGYSRNPSEDVHGHNTLAINDPVTRPVAPHWILDTVIGPFISASLAIECREKIIQHARGKEVKRMKMAFYSDLYGVPLQRYFA